MTGNDREQGVNFGTLLPDGSVVDERIIKRLLVSCLFLSEVGRGDLLALHALDSVAWSATAAERSLRMMEPSDEDRWEAIKRCEAILNQAFDALVRLERITGESSSYLEDQNGEV